MGKKLISPAGELVAALIDEVLRLRGRVLSATRELNEQRGLSSHSQGMLLTAVVRAIEPPTVAKIARSLGFTRQSVQRTANELADGGLIRFEDNPHHKRAKQIVATEAGFAAYSRTDDVRGQWVDQIGDIIDKRELEQAIATLRRIRRYIEHPDAQIQPEEKPEKRAAGR
jgi:DNA-binding MarR family transcriptional regulator